MTQHAESVRLSIPLELVEAMWTAADEAICGGDQDAALRFIRRTLTTLYQGTTPTLIDGSEAR